MHTHKQTFSPLFAAPVFAAFAPFLQIIHTYTHTYIRTHVHAHRHTYIHTYTHTDTHTHTRTCIHTHTYIHTCTHTHINTFSPPTPLPLICSPSIRRVRPVPADHTYIHTRTCIHIHTYIHTCTQTHTQTFSPLFAAPVFAAFAPFLQMYSGYMDGLEVLTHIIKEAQKVGE